MRTSKDWLEAAEQVRRLARNARDPFTITALHQVAKSYDKLAWHALEREKLKDNSRK